MSNQETEQCRHQGFLSMVDDSGFPNVDVDTPCPDCGKKRMDIYEDVNDIDPTERVSQQPHGKSTYYCNRCEGMVEPMKWENEECCPYHQKRFDDGTLLWDDVEDSPDDW